MKLSVFGLGYVGCVSAACLADAGNEVIGVDVNPTKVEIINAGKSPIVEDGINELIAKVVKAGRLLATTDSARAIRDSDLSLVCVGTPSNQNGSLHLRHVEQVCREIRIGAQNKERTSRGRDSQHHAAGNYSEHRRTCPRRDIRKESSERILVSALIRSSCAKAPH